MQLSRNYRYSTASRLISEGKVLDRDTIRYFSQFIFIKLDFS